MLRSITEYNCRFVHDLRQPAYVIVRRKVVSDRPGALVIEDFRNSFYTIPFYNKHTRDASNAIVAFQTKELAADALLQLPSMNWREDVEVTDAPYPIKEIMYFGTLLKLPTVIILALPNNDAPEIFYHDSRKKSVKPTDIEHELDYPNA